MKKQFLSIALTSVCLFSCKNSAENNASESAPNAENTTEVKATEETTTSELKESLPKFDNEKANELVSKIQTHLNDLNQAVDSGNPEAMEAITQKGLEIAKEQNKILDELPEADKARLKQWYDQVILNSQK
ncbi:MAG: hypothetical protein C4K58_02925 [Flavobacteriaceae bacterium]|nr:MAG: hypothetical protein C4K58_02925 [Flavobacteriaceae bacterium]